MPIADDHFQSGLILLDQARLDSNFDLYLLAAAEFQVASELIDSANPKADHELASLSAYYLYEAHHARALYAYEKHDIPSAKSAMGTAASCARRSAQSLDAALRSFPLGEDRDRVVHKLKRQNLCRTLDQTWISIFDARQAFDLGNWQECVQLYDRILEECQTMRSDCRKLSDRSIESTIEGNYFAMLGNKCQAAIGVIQSQAPSVHGGVQLTPEQLITIARNWLNAYRFVIDAITAHPGVQFYYSTLNRFRSQLEQVAEDAPWKLLLKEFEQDADLIAILRAINADKLAGLIPESGNLARAPTSCRVLFLSSDPSDADRLNVDREAGELLYVLRGATPQVNIDVVFRWAAKPTDLQQAVLSCRPNIVHFSGHGTDRGEIVMEDYFGRGFSVPAKGLARLFQSFFGEVRVVVLNACYSSVQADAIAMSVDCVIGMSDSILDSAARRFAVAFYRALSFGRSVKQAFDLGCNEILLNGIEGDELPRLIVRTGVDPAAVFVP